MIDKQSPPVPPRVLTVAGSDSSGAAGAQADLKTYAACGVYGLSVLTVITAQNSTGIQAIQSLPIEFIAQQLDSVLSDIGADVIKTGLLYRADVIRLVAEKAVQYQVKTLIVDPVLVDGRGRTMVDAAAIDAYRTILFPRALIVTPNLDEASILTGQPVSTLAVMRSSAKALTSMGVRYGLVKGGHAPGDQVIDLLYDRQADRFYEFVAARLPAWNARGTGCTFASTVAAEVAKGAEVPVAVEIAKQFVTEALNAAADWSFGAGRGTIWHGYKTH